MTNYGGVVCNQFKRRHQIPSVDGNLRREAPLHRMHLSYGGRYEREVCRNRSCLGKAGGFCAMALPPHKNGAEGATMTKCIDNLTFGEIKELMSIFGSQSQPSQFQASINDSHWKVGEAYIIRTVTMILTGRLEKVTPQELVVSSAAWIADTGRYMDAIHKGKLNEVEPYGDNEVIIGRGAVIDATIWTHKLPREQK